MSGRRRRFQRALKRHRQRTSKPFWWEGDGYGRVADTCQKILNGKWARAYNELLGTIISSNFILTPAGSGKVLFAPSEGMGPCYDAQNFFDPDLDRGKWAGDHTTSAAPPGASFGESWKRVTEAIRSLKEKIVLPPPTVEFFYVHGSKDVAVLINGNPAGVLTAAQLEELKAKLKEPPVGG